MLQPINFIKKCVFCVFLLKNAKKPKSEAPFLSIFKFFPKKPEKRAPF